jgi:hypothetical protein
VAQEGWGFMHLHFGQTPLVDPMGTQRHVETPALSVPAQPDAQVGGGLAVPIQPTELAYPLRRDEFDLLCETETINEDKRWRDVALAFFAAAITGVLSFIGSIDWDLSLASKHWGPLACTVLLGVLAGVSFVVFVIQHMKVRRKPASTAYARVKVRITAHYEQH